MTAYCRNSTTLVTDSETEGRSEFIPRIPRAIPSGMKMTMFRSRSEVPEARREGTGMVAAERGARRGLGQRVRRPITTSILAMGQGGWWYGVARQISVLAQGAHEFDRL
jgi:hypothetical protein